ncbi:Ankyrin-1 [Dactylella cylindrospora]|nr:Ankyrin-1 [Dactylella cylindrospora]
MRGALGIVERLLESDTSATTDIIDCTKALQHACSNGDDEMVHLLLAKSKADINLQPKTPSVKLWGVKWSKIPEAYDSVGGSAVPLALAVRRGSYHIVNLLLENGADPNNPSYQDTSPITYTYSALHVASHYGYVDIARALIERGADVNAKCAGNPSIRDEFQETPLHTAIISSHTEMIKLLIGRHADIHHKSADGRSLLHRAAFSGNKEVVRTLINLGLDPNYTPMDDLESGIGNPLTDAIAGGHFEIAKYLLSHGAEIPLASQDPSETLLSVVFQGNLEFTKLILDKIADIETAREIGQDAMRAAVRKGHIVVAKMLIDKGFQMTEEIVCELLFSLSNSKHDKLRLLFELGVDPNELSTTGGLVTSTNLIVAQIPLHRARTLLEAAASINDLASMRLLLECGARATDGDPIFCLHAAYSNLQSLDLVQLLLQNGAVVSINAFAAASMRSCDEVLYALFDALYPSSRKDIIVELIKLSEIGWLLRGDLGAKLGRHGLSINLEDLNMSGLQGITTLSEIASLLQMGVPIERQTVLTYAETAGEADLRIIIAAAEFYDTELLQIAERRGFVRLVGDIKTYIRVNDQTVSKTQHTTSTT